jgi:hypothetical protein
VVIPSAGIPAISFVITAIMPVRSPEEMKPPDIHVEFADSCRQSQIKRRLD